MKILHVTEAMAGGVLTLLASLSMRQVNEGAHVTVYFVARDDTPSDEVLRSRFDPRVVLVRQGGAGTRISKALTLGRYVLRASSSSYYDIIHLHSSIAGGVGRIARMLGARKSRVVYSPHGFAFLRTNKNGVSRFLTLLIESALARCCDDLILTSESEQRLANKKFRLRNTKLLKTGITPDEVQRAGSRSTNRCGLVRIGMVGRICYQKAPWRFANVARKLHGRAEFVWIGSGSDDDIDNWLAGSDVKIMGWLPPDELREAIDDLDILVFPTLWEGMSLALMQAQARGVPAVVSNAIGNVDSVLDNRTGFICDNDDEIVEKVALLIEDADLRKEMSINARLWAFDSLTDQDVGKDSITLYRSARLKETVN